MGPSPDRHRGRTEPGVGLLLLLCSLLGCTEKPSAPSHQLDRDLIVLSPAPGSTVLGSWVEVHLQTPGFRFISPGGRLPAATGIETIEGYAQVWFDRDPDGSEPDIMTTGDFTFRQVAAGDHSLVVELVDAGGLPLDPRLRRAVSFRTANLLRRIEQDIFTPSCALSSCHGGPAPRGDLLLTPGAAYAQLVNVLADNDAARSEGLKRVLPFNPDLSFLWMKINNPPPEYGQRMPLTGSPLPADLKGWIRRWIEQGALPDDF